MIPGAPVSPRAVGGRLTEADLNRTAIGRGAKRLISVVIAANFLPAALLFYFIRRYGIDVPFFDEWNGFVIPLERLEQGRLGFFGLFAQHVEHRPFFPRLLTLANATLFHWDRKAEMYVTAALLMLAAWLLYRFVRAYWAHPLTPLLFLPIVWTLLSWRQWQNLLFAFQTCYGLLVAGAVLAFYVLGRARTADRFVSAAAMAAFVASYSTGGGLLIWPLGLAQLLLQRWHGEHDEKPGPGAFLVWAGAGALTWASYFARYHAYPWQYPTGPAYLMRNPLSAARYVATMIGSPLSWDQSTAQSLGIIVMALGALAVVYVLLREPGELAGAAPLLSLMAFALISAVTACNYRMGGEGIAQALASRYCSVTMLGLVSLYALLTRFAVTGNRPAAWLAGGMAAFLTLGTVTSYLSWRADSDCLWMLHADTVGTYVLRYPDLMSDEGLRLLNPDPHIIREGIPFLRAHGYSLFHEAVPPLPSVPSRYDGNSEGCNIEAVSHSRAPVTEIGLRKNSGGVEVEGWALDLAAKTAASRVFVSIDGKIDIPAVPGGDRPDVAEFFKNSNYAQSGFVSFVRTSLFTVGEHTLELKIVDQDGASYRTCGAAHVQVTP
jgi:hypothetical protein